ncbi:hypothetical protein C8F01DRAFT_624437 [Mycena amicta]|nr:hypothetical protein C8F01DRAFT_624437 [Mycena amicta]
MSLTIVDLPFELIELIVDQLPDNDSLRSCCLTASILRLPCQKRLLRSLRLSYRAGFPGWRTYTEVAAVFDASPPLAGYVTSVFILFAGARNEWDHHKAAAESVLRRLTHVRTAEIRGAGISPRFDKGLIVEVLDSVLDILRTHGTMSQLGFHRVHGIPLDVMRRVFTSAPSLTFRDATSVEDSSSPSLLSVGSLPGRGLFETLQVGVCPTVTALLLRPEFAPYTNSLRNLSFYAEKQSEGSNFALCFLATQTLQCIELIFPYKTLAHDPASMLPSHLPSLRRLLLTLHNNRFFPTWKPPYFLLSLLSPSNAPVLTDIALELSFSPPHAIPVDGYTGIILASPLMEMLDTAFVGHPALERVHWSVLFPPKVKLDTFSAALHRALPKSSARGLLLIEDL